MGASEPPPDGSMRVVGSLAARLLLSFFASSGVAGYVMLGGVAGDLFSIWWVPGRVLVVLLNMVGFISEPSSAAAAIWQANFPLAFRCGVLGWTLIFFFGWLLLDRFIQFFRLQPSYSPAGPMTFGTVSHWTLGIGCAIFYTVLAAAAFTVDQQPRWLFQLGAAVCVLAVPLTWYRVARWQPGAGQ